MAAAVAVSAALAAPIAGATRGLRRAFGARIVGPFDSPQYRDGIFHNRQPAGLVAPTDQGSVLWEFLTRGDKGRPHGTVPVQQPVFDGPAADLAATWLGHATVLLEVGGHYVLTDPVWSERVSPSPTVGPRRHHPVPMALADLPELSAVVISHDHYDHLDTATVDALLAASEAPFVVPLGIGEHLRSWGAPAERIVELDWDQTWSHDGLSLTCTEAQHFSGRGLTSRNQTLWSSWVIRAGGRSVFFGGDTGYTPAFADLGAAYGPFDLTLIPIGAYDPRWREVHLDPVEAVQTHLDVGGELLLPIHWATFDLAFHGWADPADWLVREAAEAGVAVVVPRPGERVVPATVAPATGEPGWWGALTRGRVLSRGGG